MGEPYLQTRARLLGGITLIGVSPPSEVKAF
jgi:hypothetical protein